MSNHIILLEQTFKLPELCDQFPDEDIKKRVVFQAELRSLDKGHAVFGIIAYPCWREGKAWKTGKKITGAPTGKSSELPFREAIGMANNELVVGINKKKKKALKKTKHASLEFHELYREVTCDPELAKNAIFRCVTSISANPHLEYNVSLESSGRSAFTMTNPSPPGNPES